MSGQIGTWWIWPGNLTTIRNIPEAGLANSAKRCRGSSMIWKTAIIATTFEPKLIKLHAHQHRTQIALIRIFFYIKKMYSTPHDCDLNMTIRLWSPQPYNPLHQSYGIILLATTLHFECSSVCFGWKFPKNKWLSQPALSECYICFDFVWRQKISLFLWVWSITFRGKIVWPGVNIRSCSTCNGYRYGLRGWRDIGFMDCGVGGNFRCGCYSHSDISQNVEIQ